MSEIVGEVAHTYNSKSIIKCFSKPKYMSVEAIDCSELEEYLKNNCTFEAYIIDDDTQEPRALLVDIMHCSDWSQYFKVQENPRALVQVQTKDEVSLNPNTTYEFVILLRSNTNPDDVREVLRRTFSLSEQCPKIEETLISSDETFSESLTIRNQKTNVERSIGDHKNLTFQLTNDMSITTDKDKEYDVVDDKWMLNGLQYHFSIWNLL
ncbi:HSP70 cognate protein [Acrasis kona]|uniref:HSP70 cognate protein n=1 Tax=Acrasis kona TaxID=1008807 RepID=A0AAW2Z8X9_9EUKA